MSDNCIRWLYVAWAVNWLKCVVLTMVSGLSTYLKRFKYRLDPIMHLCGMVAVQF